MKYLVLGIILRLGIFILFSSKLVPTSNNVTTSQYFSYRLIGRIAELRFLQLSTGLPGSEWNTLATLPEEYFPRGEIVVATLVGNVIETAVRAVIKVSSTGEVQLYLEKSNFGRIWANFIYFTGDM